MADVEGQEVAFADPGGKVGADLFASERAIMDGGKTDHPFPRAITGGFVAEYQGEGVVPGVEQARGNWIGGSIQFAIDVDLATVHRVEGHRHMLQAGLQRIVSGGQYRLAVTVGGFTDALVGQVLLPLCASVRLRAMVPAE